MASSGSFSGSIHSGHYGPLAAFDEDAWYSLVDFVTVYSKDDIRFTFKNGKEIRV